MANQEITIPGELPHLNAALAGAKKHWSSYAQIKRQQTNKVAWIARTQLDPVTAPVDLVFHWTTKHRRVDPDNISHGSKYVIDGLVNAGILPNDGRRTIRSLTHHFPDPDPKAPRVTIRLIEIEGSESAEEMAQSEQL